MEFGPRALGARSIIGDARSPELQSTMNVKIKFRESFRPFAPVVLEGARRRVLRDGARDRQPVHAARRAGAARSVGRPRRATAARGFDKLKVVRSEIPAVTHVDYSARVQTIDPERDGRFYQLVKTFEALTGCPVIINTSFNVRGEPIVRTPAHAYPLLHGHRHGRARRGARGADQERAAGQRASGSASAYVDAFQPD